MPQPLTDAINALTTYANTVTGASDTTLSDAVATLASGYGQGGEDFFGKLHFFEVEMEEDALTIPITFSETFTYAPPFLAIYAELPYVTPTGLDTFLSGAMMAGGSRNATLTSGTSTTANSLKPNGRYDYWNSWGNFQSTQTGATINITRANSMKFTAGQKYKILVMETTDDIR